MLEPKVESQIRSAPQKCGVYRYFDKEGRALYIGKAKNLAKRLTSYLRPDVDHRIAKMLSLATNLDWVVCQNEGRALLTEALQIRDMQPRYNILLKDDKSFLEICFSGQNEYGGLFVRRIGRRQQNTQYSSQNQSRKKVSENMGQTTEKRSKEVSFGPFLSGAKLKQVMELLQKTFLIRDCTSNVFATHKKAKRPCLQYYIKRCCGPCAGLVTKEEYRTRIDGAISFCQGKTTKVLKDLQAKMLKASAETNYELAKTYRDQIHAITEMSANVSSRKLGDGNVDFISIEEKDGAFCFYVRLIRGYSDIGTIDLFASANDIKGQKTDENIAQMIVQFYHNKNVPSKIIIANTVEPYLCKVISNALKQDKGKSVVVQSGARNEQEEIEIKKTNIGAKYALSSKALRQTEGPISMHKKIGELFKLPGTPNRIEIFDNSHLFGTNAIGGMVVVTPDGFVKKSYRSYSFKEEGISTNDDYGMMKSMIRRRLERLREEIENGMEANQAPDLLIIDGGLGHLRAVREVMEETGIYVPFVAMAKGLERNAGKEDYYLQNEEIATPGHNTPVALYLQKIRDEAHRFAITLHRKKRSKEIGASELDRIEGVGEKRKIALLSHFGSILGIKNATIEQIANISGINRAVAQKIHSYFNGQQ